MKGKLIKTGKQEYRLYTNDSLPFATTDNSPYKKLSFKNCEAIENGYDLEELFKSVPHTVKNKKDYWKIRAGFMVGFQTAMQILGDKKFSEDDVLKIVTHVLNELVLVDGFDKKYLFPESIYQETTTKCKSLQQTEWEVEVVMDRIPADLAPGGWDVFPKLDAESCLILKRVE